MSLRQGGLWLSKEELKIFEVIEMYRREEFTREEAEKKLRMNPRTFSRKLKAVREKGIAGLVHGNRGRTPWNKKANELKQWYVSLYKQLYYDFNFSHAYQFIMTRHEVPATVCYDVFRRWLREAGEGKRRKRRSNTARRLRERQANEGLMLQMDGSPDYYNGKDQWTLINIIDDATSKLWASEFHLSETTFACMQVLRKVIEEYGVPEFILTDGAGWAKRTGKRAHFTQFERACNELGITVISTSVPESKGRVERSFRTCQDRLIPELRLAGIETMIDGNRYLRQVFKPDWNNRFSVESKSSATRFQPLPAYINLDEIFCLKETRLVNRDHTITYKGQCYRLTEPPKNLHKHEITVHEQQNGQVEVYYGKKKLPSEKYKKPRLYRRAI